MLCTRIANTLSVRLATSFGAESVQIKSWKSQNQSVKRDTLSRKSIKTQQVWPSIVDLIRIILFLKTNLLSPASNVKALFTVRKANAKVQTSQMNWDALLEKRWTASFQKGLLFVLMNLVCRLSPNSRGLSATIWDASSVYKEKELDSQSAGLVLLQNDSDNW